MTLPVCVQIASMSKETRRRASLLSAASTASASAMPSPSADFSVIP